MLLILVILVFSITNHEMLNDMDSDWKFRLQEDIVC